MNNTLSDVDSSRAQCKQFSIVFPPGAFGNHLRWILLLSPEYSFRVVPTREEYSRHAGSDWPTYENYLNNDFTNVQSDILHEIKGLNNDHKLLPPCKFNDNDSKLKFIENYIYCNERSWHNWLIKEWEFRQTFDPMIYIDHDLNLKDPDKRIIILTIDPMLALKSYLKFNSSLNNVSAEFFLKRIRNFNNRAVELSQQERFLILDTTVLFNQQLDRSFYNRAIKWSNQTDRYEIANVVHGLWYQCHIKSQCKFLEDIENFYKHQKTWWQPNR
jgi:hypothetical protein